ncbi:MAG: hypothetical protein WA728_33595 [Xanthobacteraceae bacterium]
MTTSRQQTANRENARASTGPRTAAGQARAKRNARRHGLAARNRLSGGLAEEVKALAHQIAGRSPSSTVLTAAGRIAEAQIDLVQVRAAHRQLIAPSLSDEETFVWSDVAMQLRALDRYERRALSRRKRASEDLDTIRILECALLQS